MRSRQEIEAGPGIESVIERGDRGLGYRDIDRIARHDAPLRLGAAAKARIANGRAIVERIVERREHAYGITTGLGALSDIVLSSDELTKLSRNTLLSHACGMGDALKRVQVRAIMAALVNDLCHGHSGASPALIDQLVACLNLGITPVVPRQGSVGYIVHGAHIGLCMIGVGDAEYQGAVMPAAKALEKAGLAPVPLGAKDGLCLVNGTRCLTGLSAIALREAEKLADWADAVAAMSFEALRGQTDAFDEDVLKLKPHPGLLRVGENLRKLLAGSEILAKSKGLRTQDALSIRSIPQIHGATRDQLDHVRKQVEIELQSATDNPLVLGDISSYRVISNAHPHGQSLAMAMDLLAIAAAELGSVAERRLDRLINPLVSGLPAFLVARPGVNSGMMIAQYAAASIANENRRLAQPAVLDNAVTSGLQEDHVSFGVTAALKAANTVQNAGKITAIELVLAGQALEFHGDLRRGKGTDHVYRRLRKRIPAYTEDRYLSPDLAEAERLLQDDAEMESLIAVVGPLS